ncbi:MAG: hypothetical protein ACOYVF_11390 [Candidatus Zixiibacteriota bacterium]
MKKILSAVVLVVLLLGISYYQIMRQDKRESALYKEGYQSGQKEVSNLRENLDSLNRTLDSQEVSYSEYLGETTRVYSMKVDSLEALVKSKDSEIQKLTKNTTSQATQPKKVNKNQEILNYYKSLYNDLPGDLSEYERRVALSEIREKTVRKFSISISQLDKIRKDNNLNY